MALKVWLPLNKDLRSAGLSKVTAINSGATLDNNGIIGKCYNISLGKYIGLDAKNVNNHKYSPISIALWVYPTQNDSTSRSVFGCWENGGGGFYFKSKKMGFNLYIGGAYHSCEMPSTLSLNTWHHICGTYDEKVMRLYIDGVEVATTSVSGKITYHSTCPWEIGGNPGATAFAAGNFAGKFNDIRIYDHCISESDVERIYNGDTKMLQVWLPFNNDCRNVGLENVKPSSAGTFQIVSDTTGLKCAKFGASTGYVKIPHDIFKKNTEMSMTFSINFNSWNTSYATPIGIFKSNNSWTGNTFTFLRNATTQVFFFNISDGTSSTQSGLKTGNLSLNTWYHFACVYKDRKMSLYQNGTLLGTYIPSFDPIFTAATLAIVGASTTGGSYQTDSKMSNVRFYNLALTDEDVQRIYQNEEIILLPTEYEKLEYIQSTGTQWIDVGVKANQNTKAEIKFEITGNATGYNAVFGSRTSYSSNAFNVWSKCGNGNIGANYCKAGAINSTIAQAANVIYHITLEKNKLSVNGNVTTFTQNTNFTTPGNIYLFNIYGGDATSTGTSNRILIGKVYSFKLYDSDIIIRNMIPSRRKSDNVIGMYDMVSRQFFTNSGTGSFTGA